MFTTRLVSSAERARVRTVPEHTRRHAHSACGVRVRTGGSDAHARARTGVSACLSRLRCVSRWLAASQQGSVKFLVTTLRLGLLKMKPWFHGPLPEREEHPKQIYVSWFL